MSLETQLTEGKLASLTLTADGMTVVPRPQSYVFRLRVIDKKAAAKKQKSIIDDFSVTVPCSESGQALTLISARLKALMKEATNEPI